MSRRTGVKIGNFAPEALECLMRHTWPGNVRELRNVVEALFIDPPANGAAIRHLPPNLIRALERTPPPDLPERERILSALFATHWNKCRAAEQLQWSRMTLYRKMAKYQISDAPQSGDAPRA
jgi:transcriptional regulator of acetoin/glycerol metabolism